MEFKYPEAIVECDWLLNQLNNDNVRIYDCTTILHYTDDHPDNPYDVESGYELYKKSHISGASFLNLQNDSYYIYIFLLMIYTNYLAHLYFFYLVLK